VFRWLKPLSSLVVSIGSLFAGFNSARAQLDFNTQNTQTDSRFRAPSAGHSLFERPSLINKAAAQPHPFAQQTPHPAVVRVIAPEPGGASLGSGTLVDVNDDSGLVVTNWHVVRSARQGVLVVFPDGFQSLGQVLRMDDDWDLAGILIKRPTAAPVKVASQPPQIGELLTIAGYGGGSYRAQTGRCTQYLAPSLRHPFEIVECAATARQGDSGGPIFNSNGELAGVLFGEGGGRTSGTYCGRVHQFLLSATSRLREQSGARVAALPPTTDVASATSVAEGKHMTNGWRPRRNYGEQDDAPASTVASILPASDKSPAASSLPPYEPVSIQSTATIAHAQKPAEPQPADDRTAPSPPAVASIAAAPSPRLPLATTTPAPNTNSQQIAPTPRDGRNELTWELFAGDTLVAQAKTILAGVGVLAFLFHGSRLLARTTAPARSKRKKTTSRSHY
jgi:S1-C subfamily serine protease